MDASELVKLPEPLVPADLDVRWCPWMPLDVGVLRDSGLVLRASSEEFRAAVLLWCVAWHQVPAGSLPDDDQELAHLAGFGRNLKKWLRVRAGALRGFIRCSDGRLYHRVVCAKAVEADAGHQRKVNAGRRGGLAKAERCSSPATAPLEPCSSTALARRGQDSTGQEIPRNAGAPVCAPAHASAAPGSASPAPASGGTPATATASGSTSPAGDAAACKLAQDFALVIALAQPRSTAALDQQRTATDWAPEAAEVVGDMGERTFVDLLHYFASSAGDFWVKGRDGPPAIRRPADLLVIVDGRRRWKRIVEQMEAKLSGGRTRRARDGPVQVEA